MPVTPTEVHWEDLPPHIQHALRSLLSTHEPFYGQKVARFVEHWGDLDRATCLRVLHDPAAPLDDRLFALFAVAFEDLPATCTALLPLLESAEPKERWASGLSLGRLRDARAFPQLYTMLTEFLPPNVPRTPHGYEDGLYWEWRIEVPGLLGSWPQPAPAHVPPLRQALIEAVRVEWEFTTQAAAAAAGEGDDDLHWLAEADARNWRGYQDEIVYALGCLGAFGALTGVSAHGASEHLLLWRIHLVLGALADRDLVQPFATFRGPSELRRAVIELLTSQFGLSEEEWEDSLEEYEYGDSMLFAKLCSEARDRQRRPAAEL